MHNLFSFDKVQLSSSVKTPAESAGGWRENAGNSRVVTPEVGIRNKIKATRHSSRKKRKLVSI